MRILLVDDSKTMRNIQKKVLETLEAGIQFAEAGDGVEGLAQFNAAPGQFDIVMVDWNMPNMDGITMVRKIREIDKKTPLVMATTEAEKTRVIEALKAGVNNYVVKPFTPEQLIERVKQTIAKAKAGPTAAAA